MKLLLNRLSSSIMIYSGLIAILYYLQLQQRTKQYTFAISQLISAINPGPVPSPLKLWGVEI